MPDPSDPEQPRPSGKAASPFDTDEIRPIRVAAPAEPAPPAKAQTFVPEPAAASDGYDLVGDPFAGVEEAPPRPVPIPEPPVDRPKVKTRPKPQVTVESLEADGSGSSEFVTEVSEVDPVWTRMGEWGPDLVRVGGMGLATLVLAWLFGFSSIGVLIFLAGGAATVLLSYPLLVTMERPVRITPEQAVKDFFAAGSHHFPSYRRMWLLLSEAGRRSGPFSSFEVFREHWQGRVARWRSTGGGGKFTPLKFEVDGFRADKSTGKETSRASYTVNVYVRDREDAGPIESFRMNHGLVRGPDRMWYLNQGVLASPSK
jgi:hypothetical protein